MTDDLTGKTRDVGWQIGVSRTIAISLDAAWEYLTSTAGIDVWLGAGVEGPPVTGQTYRTTDGTTGEFRSVRPGDRVRLTWQPVDRPDDATVQIALTPAASGCTFRFHSERLYDRDEREAMRSHWRSVADAIEHQLAG